jgi:alpha-tubulin suppressor-like RCC1 family protein
MPAGLSNVVSVDAGFISAVALKGDGTVITWGAINPGGFYQTGLYDIRAISMGRNYILALRNDGTVAGAGVPSGLSNVVAISAGGNSYGLALKSDGSVVGWGGAPDTSGVTNATFINAHGGYSLVLTRWPVITRKPTGATVQPGDNYTFTVTARGAGPFTYQWKKDGTNLPNARASTLALANIGAAHLGSYSVVVGNSSGTIESLPATLALFGAPSITHQPLNQTVFEGAKVAFAVSALGRAPLGYQWYRNGTPLTGQSAPSLLIASVSSADAGAYTVVVSNELAAVESQSATLTVTAAPVWSHAHEGTVVSIGGPAVPLGLTNAVAIAAGASHALALRSDGSVVAWGRLLIGQITPPEGLSNVVAISAGDAHSLALRADGTVVGWGEESSTAPSDIYGVIGIAAGNQHTLLLKSDGSVLRYGTASALSAPPASATNCISIDAGFESDVALRRDGTVATWGGLLNPGGINPVGLSNITAVSLGTLYFLALRQDGRVLGQGVPADLSNVVAIAAGGRGLGLALKADGTVRGWGGLESPAGLSGVSAVAAGGFGLLITTNPPQPTLAAQVAQTGQIILTSPLSVSGYILEAAPTLSQPFVEVPSYTDSFALTNDSLGLQFSTEGQLGIYRLRKK